ncbi:hypothetical protein N7456_007707 [Penicillium angulare]|uniref:Uncharacterized protein n=1 Tax=Penicillium angulare TaxID=116970 RepID=A0A9W9FBB6_9EURO|nr:hypothetical protein N7456_007707 [Penicillium angulare]
MSMAIGISSLPIELRTLILQHLWDIGDLDSAIKSHRSLAEAFTGSPGTTVANVLQNEIDSRLWPLAIFIWQIRTSKRKCFILDGLDMWTVLQDCHTTYNTISAWEDLCHVGLSEAQEYFHSLHKAVQHFTTDFLSQAGGSYGQLLIPTTSEIYRVQRSFYYLELFCLLWGNGQKVRTDWDLQISQGLAIELHPWINEQIALFGDMAVDEVDNDEETGSLSSPREKSKDFWVSWGLRYLSKLTQCSNKTDLHHTMQEKQSNDGWFILRSALEELNWGYYCEKPLEDPSYMDKQQTINEDDSGPDPAQTWCSFHSTGNGGQFVLGENYSALRQAGYVMWDADRRAHIDMFCQRHNLPNGASLSVSLP